MGDTVLSCVGVGYRYADGTRAIQDISLDLRRGRVLCLLGPNGAGKTTLLRQVTTELTPTEGRVEVFGQDAHRNRAATKRRLGIIPQQASLFESLTVRDHLRLFAPLKGIPATRTREQVDRVVAECDLGGLLTRRVGSLSGGQKRKVLVALALLGDPDLLLLDEPTVGLDPVARRALWKTVDAQRKSGKAILLTTHYMEEAETLADEVGFIHRGRLEHSGTLDVLYRAVGKSVRVSEIGECGGEELDHHLFDTVVEAQRFVRQRGLEHYAVGRVSLEDVFIRLVGREFDSDG